MEPQCKMSDYVELLKYYVRFEWTEQGSPAKEWYDRRSCLDVSREWRAARALNRRLLCAEKTSKSLRLRLGRGPVRTKWKWRRKVCKTNCWTSACKKLWIELDTGDIDGCFCVSSIRVWDRQWKLKTKRILKTNCIYWKKNCKKSINCAQMERGNGT